MNYLQALFNEIENHLIQDSSPSLFLSAFFTSPTAQDMPFSMLQKLKQTEQSPIHHPEGNAWNHVLLVVDQAAKLREQSKDKKAYMWAALLHDIGKPDTTRKRKGRITSYDHDKAGAKLTYEFLSYFELQDDFIEKVVNLVRYHMHILFVIKNLPFQDRNGMLNNVDIDELALLGYADRMGRTNADETEVSATIQDFKRILYSTTL